MITLKQLIVAREMAKEYGHMWGNCPTEVLHKAVDAQDVQVIHDHVLRKFWADRGIDPDSTEQQRRSPYHGAAGPGICGPGMTDDGRTVHTTGTGRLRWAIDADGVVEIEISRPTGVVLHAIINIGETEEAITVFDDFYPRHLVALADAIRAARHAQAVAECEVKAEENNA